MVFDRKELIFKALPNILFDIFGIVVFGTQFFFWISNVTLNDLINIHYTSLIAIVLLGISVFVFSYSFVCIFIDIVTRRILSFTGILDSTSNFQRSYTIKLESEGKVLKLRSASSYRKYRDKYVKVYYGELSNKIFRIEEV